MVLIESFNNLVVKFYWMCFETKNFINDKIFSKFELAKKRFIKSQNENITFQNFFSIANKISNLLLSLGLKSGDRVLAQVEKSPFSLALYAATIRSGCVYIPLNINYTLHELEYFLENAEPSLFVFDSKYESDINEKFKLKKFNFLHLILIKVDL